MCNITCKRANLQEQKYTNDEHNLQGKITQVPKENRIHGENRDLIKETYTLFYTTYRETSGLGNLRRPHNHVQDQLW
jgi:hypothetical protein